MPYDSLEVRWFFDGALAMVAPEVEAWFRNGPQVAGGRDVSAWPDDWRDDRYLVVPGATDMGIKLREGRFEIKGLVSAFGVRSFGDRIHGRTERWMKWSHALAGNHSQTDACFTESRLIDPTAAASVEKCRIVRTLAFGSGAPTETARGAEIAGPAVGFELVRIRLGGARAESHWSIAFEAFPYGPELHEPFARTVTELLRGWPAGPLPAERSMSYPYWLTQTCER